MRSSKTSGSPVRAPLILETRRSLHQSIGRVEATWPMVGRRPSNHSRAMSKNPDRIPGRQAADILALRWPGAFNATRQRLEMVRDRHTGENRSYPSRSHFDLLASERRCSASDAERDWRRQQILVVPEWGGVSLAGGDWSYSREQCEAWLRSLTECLKVG